jgi:hypothetical protein
VILQRFLRKDWGFYEIFSVLPIPAPADVDPRAKTFELTLHGPHGEDIPVSFVAPHDFCRRLMAYELLAVPARSTAPNSLVPGRSLAQEDLVIRFCYTDDPEDTEINALKRIYKVAGECAILEEEEGIWVDKNGTPLPPLPHPVKGHVPILVAYRAWDDPFFETLKRFDRPESRRLVVALFPKMGLAAELSPLDFRGVFLDCIRCKHTHLTSHLTRNIHLELGIILIGMNRRSLRPLEEGYPPSQHQYRLFDVLPLQRPGVWCLGRLGDGQYRVGSRGQGAGTIR